MRVELRELVAGREGGCCVGHAPNRRGSSPRRPLRRHLLASCGAVTVAAPSPMPIIRRALAPAAALALIAAPASAAPVTYLFPVIGGANYFDDFGQPRGQGPHEGNDLVTVKGTPVVAVQDGVVSLDYGPRSGYMITLRSSTREFYYIHLNNDRRRDGGRGLRPGDGVTRAACARACASAPAR